MKDVPDNESEGIEIERGAVGEICEEIMPDDKVMEWLELDRGGSGSGNLMETGATAIIEPDSEKVAEVEDESVPQVNALPTPTEDDQIKQAVMESLVSPEKIPAQENTGELEPNSSRSDQVAQSSSSDLQLEEKKKDSDFSQHEAALNAYLEEKNPKPKRLSIKEMLMQMPGFDKISKLTPKLGGNGNGKQEHPDVIDLGEDEDDHKTRDRRASKQKKGIEKLMDRFVKHVGASNSSNQEVKPKHYKLHVNKIEQDSQGMLHLVQDEIDYVDRPVLEEEEDVIAKINRTTGVSPKEQIPGEKLFRLKKALRESISAKKAKEYEEKIKFHEMYLEEKRLEDKEDMEDELPEDEIIEEEDEDEVDSEEEEELDCEEEMPKQKARKRLLFVEDEAEDEDGGEMSSSESEDDEEFETGSHEIEEINIVNKDEPLMDEVPPKSDEMISQNDENDVENESIQRVETIEKNDEDEVDSEEEDVIPNRIIRKRRLFIEDEADEDEGEKLELWTHDIDLPPLTDLCSGRFPSQTPCTPMESQKIIGFDKLDEDVIDESELELEESEGAEKSEDEENEEDQYEQELEYERRKVESQFLRKPTGLFGAGGRLRKKFVEEEAEMSGSDEGSGDEDETGLHYYEQEEGDAEEIDEEDARKQNERAHLKHLLDEDDKQIRDLQEQYLERGDLEDGKQRERKFRWTNIDDEWGDEKAMMGDSDGEFEDETEEEKQRKLAELEKRIWLNQNSAMLEANEEESQKMLFENSKFLKLRKSTKQKIEEVIEHSSFVFTETSNSVPDTTITALLKSKIKTTSKAIILNGNGKSACDSSKDEADGITSCKASSVSQPFYSSPDEPKFKRGSFLSRGSPSLNRLSEFNKVNDPATNVKNNSRNFVFSVVTPPEQSSKQNKALKRPLNCHGIQPKKLLKIDRSFSNLDESSKDASIFKWM